MFPIFFSVSSSNIKFAEKVWERFPGDWVYIYSKTGEEGAHMWDEISHNELPRSQVFVVFWSEEYLTAKGCIREILQARDLAQQGRLRSVVLRLDDSPITWTDKLAAETKPVFEALGALLDYRTSSPNVTIQQAVDLVQRIAEPILRSDHPRLPRHDLQKVLRSVVQKDRYSYYPAAWVSGFNGVGRETLIKDFSHNFTPNGRAVVVEVNEASLPKQLRLRIESEGFGADREQLRLLNETEVDDEPKAIASLIERVFLAGNYLVLRHARIVEENVELPEWLDDVVNALSPSTRPKLFIISQLPLFAERRIRCRESLVAQRVPTVDEPEMTDFCHQLVGYFDRNPKRWSDEEIRKVVRASGGNIGFLVSLVRAAAGIEDFDHIDQLVADDSSTMAASITVYVRWAFLQLQDLEDEQRTLLFLNDISPCDVIDIERVVAPTRPMLRVLGKLLDLGLIEREGESLYRLTPLLATRLNRDLIRPELVTWLSGALVELMSKPFEIESDGHEYVRIEARIQASILAETDKLPSGVIAFVSAAHWFQAGVRLYHARRTEAAYRILKMAYEKRLEFSAASRTELTRYYCLSATRNRKFKEAEDCIRLLDGVFQTKDMAAFLRADKLEYQRRFGEAISEYQRSIELNRGKNSRLERTYRPLIRCILSSQRPDYGLAEDYALKWLELRTTVFGLLALGRVYLRWKYLGETFQRSIPKDIDKLYRDALAALEGHPGVGSAYFELKAEEADFLHDVNSAVAFMDKAIEADPRFELRTGRWRMMVKSKVPKFIELALEELRAAKSNSEYRNNWRIFLPNLAETFASGLKAKGQSLNALNSFAPELSGEEMGAIVNHINKSR